MAKESRKIMQIIPAPSGMYAQRLTGGCEVDEENNVWLEKIVCLALVEDKDKTTEIVPVTIDDTGTTSIFECNSSVDGIVFRGNNEDWLNDLNAIEHHSQAIRHKQ